MGFSPDSLQAGTLRVPLQKKKKRQDNRFERVLYTLLAPPPPANLEEAPLKEREIWRRGRSVAVAIFSQIMIIGFLFPIAFSGAQPALVPLIPVYCALLILSTILNRRGKVILGGIIVVTSIELILMANILSQRGGLDIFTLPLFDILIQADLFAVAVLPTRWAFSIAVLNILFVGAAFIWAPHTAAFGAMLASDKAYDAFFRPATLHFMATIISMVAISSMYRAYNHADEAGEKVKLHRQLALLNQENLDQKKMVDTELAEMNEVLTRFSGGDRKSRIGLRPNMLLWSLGGHINNLLGRNMQLQQQAEPAIQTTLALRALIESFKRSSQTGTPFSLESIPRTNTEVDILVQEFLHYIQVGRISEQNARNETSRSRKTRSLEQQTYIDEAFHSDNSIPNRSNSRQLDFEAADPVWAPDQIKKDFRNPQS